MDFKMNKKFLTCTICPAGCGISVEYSYNYIEKIAGAKCPRGENYATAEALDPRRNLTATVAIDGASVKLLPVKTSAPIPKDAMIDAMKIVKSACAVAPVKMGQVIVRDFLEPGIDLIATREL